MTETNKTGKKKGADACIFGAKKFGSVGVTVGAVRRRIWGACPSCAKEGGKGAGKTWGGPGTKREAIMLKENGGF